MKLEIDIPDEIVEELKGEYQEISDNFILTSLKTGFMKSIKEMYIKHPKITDWASDYLEGNEVEKAMVEVLRISADLLEKSDVK